MVKKNLSLFAVCLVAGFVLFGVVSCKDQSSQESDEVFDASVDGVAVRSMPRIDGELAERIVREGKAFSPTADASTVEMEVEAVAPVELSADAPSETSSGSPATGSKDYSGNDDPNNN